MAMGNFCSGTAELKYNTNTDFVKLRIDTENSKVSLENRMVYSWKLEILNTVPQCTCTTESTEYCASQYPNQEELLPCPSI